MEWGCPEQGKEGSCRVRSVGLRKSPFEWPIELNTFMLKIPFEAGPCLIVGELL